MSKYRRVNGCIPYFQLVNENHNRLESRRTLSHFPVERKKEKRKDKARKKSSDGKR